VQVRVEASGIRRADVVIRLVLLAALGALGGSSVYWAFYLALPAIAAVLLTRDGAERYLAEDAPTFIRALRWLAGAYAYLWLLTDALPTTQEGGPVELTVQVGGTPKVDSALLRLLTSLPAVVLLAVFSMAAGVLWIVAAVVILVTGRMPEALARVLLMYIQYQFRLFAYHLSLVEAYPAFTDAPPYAPRAPAT
jgi:hypothetical protein